MFRPYQGIHDPPRIQAHLLCVAEKDALQDFFAEAGKDQLYAE